MLFLKLKTTKMNSQNYNKKITVLKQMFSHFFFLHKNSIQTTVFIGKKHKKHS